MIRDWLTDQAMLAGPVLALFLFILVFAGVLYWIFRPGSRRTYEQMSRLPLDAEERKDSQREETHGQGA